MDNLVFIQHNQVVTDTLTIAEVFGKRHDIVLRDIRNQMEYAGEEFSLHNFVESTYENRGKYYIKYDLTEEAFTLVVMSYNTKETVQMKIKFIQEFKRMKEYLQEKQQPNTQLEIIQMTVNQLVEQDKKINHIEQNVVKIQHDLSERITLDSGEQRALQRRIANSVYTLTNDKEDRKKLFSELYRELRDRFAVASYKDIKSHELQMALKYVEAWIPRKNGKQTA